MDYQKHFKLVEMPFTMLPDPRFLYLSPQHNEALGKCLLTIKERSGLVAVYGSIGMGKTTISRRLYETLALDDKVTPAMLITPALRTENAFLQAILKEFDVKAKRSYADSLQAFQLYMAESAQAGKNLVVIIDEAQKLTPRMMDVIHSLLNFESNTQKFLQIVLIGQDELATNLASVPAILSRVARFAALQPLDTNDTNELIGFRWHTASGGKSSHPFTEEALKTIHELSGGLPREISKLCHESLLKAANISSNEVTAEMIKEVAPDVLLGGNK